MMRAMSQNGNVQESHEIALEAYGVQAVVTASSAELLERLETGAATRLVAERRG